MINTGETNREQPPTIDVDRQQADMYMMELIAKGLFPDLRGTGEMFAALTLPPLEYADLAYRTSIPPKFGEPVPRGVSEAVFAGHPLTRRGKTRVMALRGAELAVCAKHKK